MNQPATKNFSDRCREIEAANKLRPAQEEKNRMAMGWYKDLLTQVKR